MKKGKVFSKGQAVLVLMVIALGAAVWLNMKFTSNEKYLGEAKYVSNNKSKAALTAAKTDASTSDYFKTATEEREKNINEIKEFVDEILNSEKLSEKDKQSIEEKISDISHRLEQEKKIETLLKAKDFEKALAVTGNNNITVVVKSEGLTTAQTLQIQDIVMSESEIPLGNIKIITVK